MKSITITILFYLIIPIFPLYGESSVKNNVKPENIIDNIMTQASENNSEKAIDILRSITLPYYGIPAYKKKIYDFQFESIVGKDRGNIINHELISKRESDSSLTLLVYVIMYKGGPSIAKFYFVNINGKWNITHLMVGPYARCYMDCVGSLSKDNGDGICKEISSKYIDLVIKGKYDEASSYLGKYYRKDVNADQKTILTATKDLVGFLGKINNVGNIREYEIGDKIKVCVCTFTLETSKLTMINALVFYKHNDKWVFDTIQAYANIDKYENLIFGKIENQIR